MSARLPKTWGVAVAMIAYFVGFYGATGGCFQVLSSEGRALWMLFSLPTRIEDVLRRMEKEDGDALLGLYTKGNSTWRGRRRVTQRRVARSSRVVAALG